MAVVQEIGLSNLGNTCYMNTALQCLRHTPLLVKFFLHELNLYDVFTPQDIWAHGGGLCLEFAHLLYTMILSQGKPVRPVEFKNALGRHDIRFNNYAQNDAHLVATVILSACTYAQNKGDINHYAEVEENEDLKE